MPKFLYSSSRLFRAMNLRTPRCSQYVLYDIVRDARISTPLIVDHPVLGRPTNQWMLV